MKRIEDNPSREVDSLIISVSTQVQLFTRYPDSILEGIVAIGGFLAVLKISMMLKIYHQT